MRIIAGKYRGRNLKSPPSLQVRPTSDRLRETLFNVIAPRIEEAVFLDLCAGSGAIGIEALSRGAAHVVFIDKSPKMCALIKANLELCKVSPQKTKVLQLEACAFLRHELRRPSSPWDIVFFDPPYASDYLGLMGVFGSNTETLLTEQGILIVEHHHKNELEDQFGRLSRSRRLKQGDSSLSFYQRAYE